VKVPEDWKQQQTVFAESLVVLPRLIEVVEPERLHRAPAPGEWSAHVVICHLLLDEMNTAMILRLILTQDYPTLVAIDADNALCESRFAPLYPDTLTALGVWRVLREDNVRLCRSVSPQDLERLGRAFWRSDQRLSFRQHVASRGRHDAAHIEQIRSALAC
jgi:DinB superfamily